MGLSIGIHDGLEVLLIFFAAFPIHSDHWLTAACHCSLTLRMNPRQHLHTVKNIITLKQEKPNKRTDRCRAVPHRYSPFSSEGSHLLQLVIRYVDWHHQSCRVGFTELVAIVDFCYPPAFIGYALDAAKTRI